MNQEISLESLIRQYVQLPVHSTTGGWYTCKCAVCNDYKKRGGFKFEGNLTSYNCFNCGHTAVHDPLSYNGFSKDMIAVLDAFNIPDDQYKQITLANVVENHKNGVIHTKKPVVIDPDTKLMPIEFPSFFMPLQQATDTWSIIAKEYLQYDRDFDPAKYPFFILHPSKKLPVIERTWRGRLIIPYYRNDAVVFYQGRDLRDSTKMRYINAESASQCILSDYDIIFKDIDKPLYICEGFFDAISIKGVAIFGNRFKPGQIKILNSTKRKKVYIPDRTKDGQKAALQALEQGWSISIPDFGDCKDVSAAIHKYGLLYSLKTIQDNIIDDPISGSIRIKMLC
jgi:hypothetical protein